MSVTERKAAIVTGSATGVGAATALALARRGYDVLINYSRSESEAKLSQAACREAGADTLLLRGDVAIDADCRQMAHVAMDRWKRLDALVNNAGITSFDGAANWDAVDAQTFQQIVGVNAMGKWSVEAQKALAPDSLTEIRVAISDRVENFVKADNCEIISRTYVVFRTNVCCYCIYFCFSREL